jgi:hypothetical protein
LNEEKKSLICFDVAENTIAPSSSGYFDIVIDPTNVDVSFDYSISIDLLNENMPDLMISEYAFLNDNFEDGDDLVKNPLENSTITNTYNVGTNDKEPFTISGYEVVITYNSPERETDDASQENDKVEAIKDPITINVLKKEDFEEGFYNTVAAFVGSEVLEKYKNGTQPEIVDTGSTIENVYWDEDIKIKKAYLSTEEYIYTNSGDISKYLLFGTLEEGKKYTVRDGDDITSVAEANNLNVINSGGTGYLYCVYLKNCENYDTTTGVCQGERIYEVVTYIHFNFPVIGNMMTFAVRGETKTLGRIYNY